MYSTYRNYYRNRYGFFNDNSRSAADNRSSTAAAGTTRPRPRWRYNRTRPFYDYEGLENLSWFYDFSTGPSEPSRPASAPAGTRVSVPDDGAGGPAPTDGEEGSAPEGGAGEAEPGSGEEAAPAPADSGAGDTAAAVPAQPTVEPFNVLFVNLMKKTNRPEHHTDLYEHTQLIVRRGQAFKLRVKLDKVFTQGQDVIKLQFGMGNRPLESKGTMFIITPGESLDMQDACAVIDDVKKTDSGSVVVLSVNLPSDCVIGRFNLQIILKNKEHADDVRRFSKYKEKRPIYVLFNPWCKEDAVYLEKDSEREEYVLKQTGTIYTSERRERRPWSFGQFEKESLDAAMYILDNSPLPWEAYGNPVRLTRCITSMVNSNDGDGGILTGNWSGKYDDGTAPTVWNGTEGILEEYMKTKKPVKYGQCWVFSGVTTTVCRALGIPTRSVTNFDSAHDTDKSMTIDYHVTADGTPLKHLNDSVWNFHVWNEGWFKRPDLPDGNDGWQAFDATPQEASDGVMQCGPAPLAAIKEGNVHVGFDTKFVFAEVNGDRVTWLVNDLGERSVRDVRTDSVGSTISTKAVGSRTREVITNLYKHAEGSKEEREVVTKTIQHSSRRRELEAYYKLDRAKDVDMEFKGFLDKQATGHFKFRAQNTAVEPRTVSVRCHVVARYYTGIDGDDIDDKIHTMSLQPGAADEFSWEMRGSDWLNKVDEDAMIGVYCHADVKETNQTHTSHDTYEIDKPDLEVSLSESSVSVGEDVEVTVRFENVLETPLTNVSLKIDGAGMSKRRRIDISGEVGAGATVTESLTLTPRIPGQLEVIASLHSRQLVNVTGSAELTVRPRGQPAPDSDDDDPDISTLFS